MRSIRTFTANPAVDRTILVDELRLDEPLRPVARVELAGGKGINAARAIVALGGRARCHGAVAGRAGRWVVEALEAEGLDHELVAPAEPAGWTTRTTTVVAGPDHAVLVYDRGDEVPSDVLRRAIATCLRDLEPAAWLIVSGSLPPGDHQEAFGGLFTDARALGARVLVDSSGDGLRRALDRGVDIVKVDHREAEEVTGQARPAASAQALLEGCDRAVVTAGAAGAVAATRGGESLSVATPTVDARHPAGSGDAFAGALVLGLASGDTWPVALRAAAAAGAANTVSLGAGVLDRRVHEQLLDVTEVPRPIAPSRH